MERDCNRSIEVRGTSRGDLDSEGVKVTWGLSEIN